MELNIKNTERLIRAVEIAFSIVEIEYNSLVLRRRMGENFLEADKLRIAELMEMSQNYSKLRDSLKVHLEQSKSKLSD